MCRYTDRSNITKENSQIQINKQLLETQTYLKGLPSP